MTVSAESGSRPGWEHSGPPALAVRDLTVAYHQKPVLRSIELAIPQGVLAAIVGPNGAGKTTLLKAILGLVPLVSGRVEVLGQSYHSQRRRLAYVPQRGSVDWDFPTSALDVVMMGTYGRLGWLRRPGARERQEAEAALERLGLSALGHRQIRQLSGGQQQRVFLARALVQQADVFVMDEPFQGIDATTEDSILELMQQLRADGRTVVVVHHDLQTVQEDFDWVAILNERVIAAGPVASTFTAENLQLAYHGRSLAIRTALADRLSAGS